MLYFGDLRGCRELVSSGTAFLVSDRDFILKTFTALTWKDYFEAEGTISYVDGVGDYTFKTTVSTSGRSDISDLLRGPLYEQFGRIRGCSMKVDFIYKYPGECPSLVQQRHWTDVYVGARKEAAVSGRHPACG